MRIIFSRHIYPLSCTLGLVTFKIFMNHPCVISCRDSCTQICAHFYATLINEGRCL